MNLSDIQQLWQEQQIQDESHYPIDKKTVMKQFEERMRPMAWSASPKSFLAGALFASLMGTFYLLTAWESQILALWQVIGLGIGLLAWVGLNLHRYRVHKQNSLPMDSTPILLYLRAALVRVKSYRRMLLIQRYSPGLFALYLAVCIGPMVWQSDMSLKEGIAIGAFIAFAIGIVSVLARYSARPEFDTYTQLEADITETLAAWEAENQG